MTLKDLLDLYKDPDNHEEIQRMLAAKRNDDTDNNADDTDDLIYDEQVEDDMITFVEQPA